MNNGAELTRGYNSDETNNEESQTLTVNTAVQEKEKNEGEEHSTSKSFLEDLFLEKLNRHSSVIIKLVVEFNLSMVNVIIRIVEFVF